MISNLTELAALDNNGATESEKIKEGKTLAVLDTGSGFSANFIYRLGTLPADTLGINSIGVPGGYWETLGYKDLVDWVVSQNFSIEGHTHTAAGVIDFDVQVNNLIASATIDYININGRPDSVVESVNGETGVVTITLESLGGSATGDLIPATQIIDFELEVQSVIGITSLYVDWENISSKPLTATDNPTYTEVAGLTNVLDQKQNLDTSLSEIAFIGSNPPSTGLLEKTANQTWQLISLVTSKISGFIEDVNALIDSAMLDLSKYPSALSAIAQLTGSGYLELSGGTWQLSTPAGTTAQPGNYGDITSFSVEGTSIVLVPALSEDSYVRITIDPSEVEKLVYFTDNSTDASPSNRSFLLQTGFQGSNGELGLGTLFAAGTEIRAMCNNGVAYVYIQTAPILT